MRKWIARILGVVILVCMLGCQEEMPEDIVPETAATTEAPLETTAEPTTVPETTAATLPPETTVPIETEPLYIPDIYPDVVGIYIPADNGTKDRVLITEFSSARKAKKDIDCFEIFASTEETVTGKSFRAMWNAVWESHEIREGAKIGFEIAFSYGDTQVRKTLLKPSDAKEFYDYLEIYMYDDINQTPGQWYSHLEDKDMDEETIISSIKLTAGSKIAQVGDITLTAFIYNGDDCFNSRGEYIGQVLATVVITEK